MRIKNRIKLVCATLFALFNLTTCFVGTYAWFVASQSTNAAEMQVQMYTHELDMSYRVYKYDDNVKAPVDATGTEGALILPEYDSVIVSRNENTAIILEFLVSGIALGENIPLTISAYCSNNSASSRCISNIIALKFATISSITSYIAADIYTQAVDYFVDVDGSQFVNNGNKTQTITYALNDYAAELVNGALRLFIMIDYVPALVDSFEFSFDDASTTAFSNDLTSINCATSQEL
jgi:hypothetical protein